MFFLRGLLIVWMTFPYLWAAESVPYELKDVGIEDKRGVQISLDLEFINEEGKTVSLRSLFSDSKPVILTLVYYTCPNLCNLLLNGLVDVLKKFSWNIGDEFKIVSISIDPKETPRIAQAKKKNYLEEYCHSKEVIASETKQAHRGSDGIATGSCRTLAMTKVSENWHFLTGREENIKKIAEELGFSYKYDPDQKQFAHGAALFILTQEGVLSRTLYGIQFKEKDLRLSLLEASQGKIGNFVDRLLLFCYHYDPKGRRYSLYAVNFMKVGALITVLGIVLLMFMLSRVRRKKLT
ncbi:MAG: SCO family protein [Deltaproteobacteria bacterium]|nr:SCO family protein [Deltaproteobacteria bacterium]